MDYPAGDRGWDHTFCFSEKAIDTMSRFCANQAVAVDGGIRRPFYIGRFCPAATEPQR